MDRIGVCGKCLKTACYCELIECEKKDDGVNFDLLKTIDELIEIGKENMIFTMTLKGEPIEDGWRVIRKEGGLFDIACREV